METPRDQAVSQYETKTFQLGDEASMAEMRANAFEFIDMMTVEHCESSFEDLVIHLTNLAKTDESHTRAMAAVVAAVIWREIHK